MRRVCPSRKSKIDPFERQKFDIFENLRETFFKFWSIFPKIWFWDHFRDLFMNLYPFERLLRYEKRYPYGSHIPVTCFAQVQPPRAVVLGQFSFPLWCKGDFYSSIDYLDISQQNPDSGEILVSIVMQSSFGHFPIQRFDSREIFLRDTNLKMWFLFEYWFFYTFQQNPDSGIIFICLLIRGDF